MKKYLIILTLLTSVQIAAAQQKTIARFIITDASINNQDYTETYLNAGGYIAFYTINDGNIYMTNIMSKRNTQSYGRLYAAETKNLNETYESYKADIFYFQWRYINTYDTKKGPQLSN